MAPVLTVHVLISQFKTIHNKACDSTLLTFSFIQLLGALTMFLIIVATNPQFSI